MKLKLTELAERLGIPFKEALRLKQEKLAASELTGIGTNTMVTEKGAEEIELAVAVPLAVPTQHEGVVLREAPNPNYVYAKLNGIEGAWPVVIPRRLRGKLLGKRIPIHAITDANGTTYRHANLTGHHHR